MKTRIIFLCMLSVALTGITVVSCNKTASKRQDTQSVLKAVVTQWQTNLTHAATSGTKNIVASIVAHLDYSDATIIAGPDQPTLYVIRIGALGGVNKYLTISQLENYYQTVGIMRAKGLEEIIHFQHNQEVGIKDSITLTQINGKILWTCERLSSGQTILRTTVPQVRFGKKNSSNATEGKKLYMVSAPPSEVCIDWTLTAYDIATGDIYSETYVGTTCDNPGGTPSVYSDSAQATEDEIQGIYDDGPVLA